MNWETYKLLSPKQKEEYNFRFKDDAFLPIRGLLTTTLLFYSTIIILIFIMFIAVREPALAEYKEYLQEYLGLIGKTVWIIAWIIVAVLLEFVFKIAWRQYQYRKWVKENNVKIITWWSEWRK